MDFLGEIERKLDIPPAEKEQVLRELRSHYEELRTELASSGMDAHAAEQEAARRFGDAGDVASRLRTVHCQATWRSAWLAVLPFLLLLLASLTGFAFYAQLRLYPGVYPSRSLATLGSFLMLVFGGLMILGSIRELKAERRPVWLATWMAVGILLLCATPLRLIFVGTTSPGDWHRIAHHLLFITISQTVIVGALAIWAARRSPTWRGILLGLVVINIGILNYAHSAVFVGNFPVTYFVVPTLINAPLVMAVALGVLARHPYGSIPQASLFLFAYYVAGSPRTATSDLAVALTFMILGLILAGATVLICARASTWQHKIVVLAAGTLATSSLYPLSTGIAVAKYGVEGIVPAMGRPAYCAIILLVWVVLVPLLFERGWSARRPQVAE